MLDFDEVLKQVHDFGIYQKVLYFLICLPASFPCAWSAFNQAFVSQPPPHWCRIPEFIDNDTANLHRRPTQYLPYKDSSKKEFHACLQYNYSSVDQIRNDTPTIPCQNGWDWDTTTYTNTIVTEFQLFCDQEALPVLSMTIFYVGSFIGNILFGFVADKWGRRTSFFTILCIQVFIGTASAFSPSVYVFSALRFIVGLTFPALYQIPYIIGVEMVGPSGRIFTGMVVCIFFAIAMCCLGFLAFFFRDWQHLTLVSNAPFAILLCYWWILPESPRWLVSERRAEEATDVLMNIAKRNGVIVNRSVILQQCERLGHKDENSPEDKEHKHTLADLFHTPNLRRKTIILTFIWLVNALVYNGLTYNVSNLGVNDYFAFAINGAVELPAYFLIWPLFNRLGRRWMLVFFMMLGGVACLACMIIPEEETYMISGFAFLGKFGNAASFAILYVFASELYPTVVRAIGMGFGSMVAGSALILAPYLVYLAHFVRILPLLIMGSLMILAGIASMFLPETTGSHLPQTIHDAETYGVGFGFCYVMPPRSNYSDNGGEEATALAAQNPRVSD